MLKIPWTLLLKTNDTFTEFEEKKKSRKMFRKSEVREKIKSKTMSQSHKIKQYKNPWENKEYIKIKKK